MAENYVSLTNEQIRKLKSQGCSSSDWSRVQVAADFDTEYVRRTHLSGDIRIGSQNSTIELFGGIKRHCGIYNSEIHNSTIGSNVYINSVDNYIANYLIEDDVIINHVRMLAVESETSFGNGTTATVINESGGREIRIFDRLSAHLAYIAACYRHNKPLIEAIDGIVESYVAQVSARTGRIARGARILNCGTIRNVKIGPAAVLDGASLLENGSINSIDCDPCRIGIGVIARDFILSSGAVLDEGTIIDKCFIGQATRLMKQYSAENCVFFANCVGAHGEACSLFAGPYTVSHHKSTLLIASLVSFLNAGSGSNQSNHMYKLGPVHQGVLERGTKTASDSYMLWPSRVGAFSLIMGRHYGNSDTSNLPFSYLIEHEDESLLVPGVNLRSVGTVRDSKKWPKRDIRKDPDVLDHIIFHLLTPYTVQKIMDGQKILEEIKEHAGHASLNFYYNGVRIRRSSLENGIEIYNLAVSRYLGNILVQKLRQSEFASLDDLRGLFSAETNDGRGKWLDISGLLAPQSVIDEFLKRIEAGRFTTPDEINAEFRRIYDSFCDYENNWITSVLEDRLDKPVREFTAEDFTGIISDWIAAVQRLDRMRIDDARKEFSLTSRTGFGIDNGKEAVDKDFAAVRGDVDSNDFIITLRSRLASKKQTAADLIERIGKL